MAGELVNDVLTHGVAGGEDRGECEVGDAIGIVLVAPGEAAGGGRMGEEGEDLDVAVEDGFAVEFFVEGNSLKVGGAASVLLKNVVLERLEVLLARHCLLLRELGVGDSL